MQGTIKRRNVKERNACKNKFSYYFIECMQLVKFLQSKSASVFKSIFGFFSVCSLLHFLKTYFIIPIINVVFSLKLFFSSSWWKPQTEGLQGFMFYCSRKKTKFCTNFFFDHQILNNWDSSLSCQPIKATLSILFIYARDITCLKRPFYYCWNIHFGHPREYFLIFTPMPWFGTRSCSMV